MTPQELIEKRQDFRFLYKGQSCVMTFPDSFKEKIWLIFEDSLFLPFSVKTKTTITLKRWILGKKVIITLQFSEMKDIEIIEK